MLITQSILQVHHFFRPFLKTSGNELSEFAINKYVWPLEVAQKSSLKRTCFEGILMYICLAGGLSISLKSPSFTMNNLTKGHDIGPIVLGALCGQREA